MAINRDIWVCWGSPVQTYPAKEDALSWKYFLENHDDGPGYCDVIEGPNGELVSDEEYEVYEADRDEHEKADRERSKLENPPLGKVQLKWPQGTRSRDEWGTVAWIYNDARKTTTLAKYTAAFGADRVRFVDGR